jgi:ABC-type Mn2+/Zn2+ transport system ATPase subunit
MAPKLIVGDRQSGRTTNLIRAAAAEEAHGVVCYIVCHSQEEAYRISQVAQKMEVNIGFPITYDEFIHRSYHGTHIDKFYIDNLRMFLDHISIVPIDTVVW